MYVACTPWLWMSSKPEGMEELRAEIERSLHPGEQVQDRVEHGVQAAMGCPHWGKGSRFQGLARFGGWGRIAASVRPWSEGYPDSLILCAAITDQTLHVRGGIHGRQVAYVDSSVRWRDEMIWPASMSIMRKAMASLQERLDVHHRIVAPWWAQGTEALLHETLPAAAPRPAPRRL